MPERMMAISTAGLEAEVTMVRGLVVRFKWIHRLLTFLIVFGPGLIVTVVDYEGGAIST